MPNHRINVPSHAKAGEVVQIRAMVMHPMENGFNFDTQGTAIPVHIISDFICRYLGTEVIRVRLEPGVSANPYFSFYLRAERTSTVEFEWIDQDGTVTRASTTLTVT